MRNKEDIIARIYEAAKYIPLDRLCLSPQCGFASCEIGNKLTEEEQWAKLKLVKNKLLKKSGNEGDSLKVIFYGGYGLMIQTILWDVDGTLLDFLAAEESSDPEAVCGI